MFQNYYRCVKCGAEWADHGDSKRDDPCICGTVMTPHKSIFIPEDTQDQQTKIAQKLKTIIADYHKGEKKYVPVYLAVDKEVAGDISYHDVVNIDTDKNQVVFFPNMRVNFSQLDFNNFFELTPVVD